MGTKANPGHFDCYHAAQDDEPMFVLLARDPIAPLLVQLWARIRESRTTTDGVGCSCQECAERRRIKSQDICEKITEALECADDMDRWRTDDMEKRRVK